MFCTRHMLQQITSIKICNIFILKLLATRSFRASINFDAKMPVFEYFCNVLFGKQISGRQNCSTVSGGGVRGKVERQEGGEGSFTNVYWGSWGHGVPRCFIFSNVLSNLCK